MGKYCHKIVHQHLSRDHHPKIAFVAVRTATVIEHTLLNLLSDAEERKGLPRRAESEAAAVEMLTETNSANDSTPPRYQVGLRDDSRKVYRGNRIHVQHFRTY